MYFGELQIGWLVSTEVPLPLSGFHLLIEWEVLASEVNYMQLNMQTHTHKCTTKNTEIHVEPKRENVTGIRRDFMTKIQKFPASLMCWWATRTAAVSDHSHYGCQLLQFCFTTTIMPQIVIYKFLILRSIWTEWKTMNNDPMKSLGSNLRESWANFTLQFWLQM